MNFKDLENLSLFVDNDCWQRIKVYSSRPAAENVNPENIVNKIKNYLRYYKIKKYEIVDCCNFDVNLLLWFCNLILKYKLDIHWIAKVIINPDSMKEYAFRKMRQAGCKKIIFELLTGSDTLLKEIGLNFTAKDASSLLRFAHQNGLVVGINLILGFPAETDKIYNETLEFLIKNRLNIDEITDITYCFSNYSRKEIIPFAFPLCRYWKQCSSLKPSNNTELLKRNYKDYLTGVCKVGIPIVNIKPSARILDYIRGFTSGYSLKSRELSFFFDNGKGRLFWKNQELTKGLGLYTSIFSSGLWQDSVHADWQIRKIDEQEIVLKGKWHFLPISQIWQIKLREDLSIIWQIEMEIFEDMNIEGEQQTNVMLREEYKNWINKNGSCGSFFEHFNDEWITLFKKEANKDESIGVKDLNSNLPSVLLKGNGLNNDYYLSVLNTSSLFCARKLKCHKIRKRDKKYTPGRYPYFLGEVKIGH